MYNHTGSLMLQTALIFATYNKEPLPIVQTLEHLQRGEDVAAVCYGQLGCFSVDYPWTSETRPVSHHPEPPGKVDPKFCLYTRQNPTNCQRLYYDNPNTFYSSSLVPTHRLYLIAHGFLESGDKKWMKVLANRLLTQSDVNVIVIGWEGGSSPPYTQAVANIRLVGTMAAHLLAALHRYVGLKTEFCHAIGHSLGAHLSGYIGNTLKTKFNLTLGRITALDPAKPHFAHTDQVVRLDPTDAIFIDVIHTDATPFIKGGLGMEEPVGHLDFYPNGGENQPGCDHSMEAYIDKEGGSVLKALRRFLGCDHVRSYEYFMESIHDQCQFLAIECNSYESFLHGECFWCRNELRPDGRTCARLGYNSIKAVQKLGAETGNIHPTFNSSMTKLYTITGPKVPYCRTLYRVSIQLSKSEDAMSHGGEVGTFSIKIFGVNGETERMQIFQEQFFKPHSLHTEVIAGPHIGRVRAAQLHWEHKTTLNVLTWRLLHPAIFLGTLTVDSLEEDDSITLCPHPNEKMLSGKEEYLRPCTSEKKDSF